MWNKKCHGIPSSTFSSRIICLSFLSIFSFVLSSLFAVCGLEISFTNCFVVDDSVCLSSRLTNDDTKDDLAMPIHRKLVSRNIAPENITSVVILQENEGEDIDRVPIEVFLMFPRLYRLNIKLPITKVPTDGLVNAKELMYLFLVSAKLHNISTETFPPMNRLKHLDLGFNEIETIGDFTFANLTLKKLELSGNKLVSINRSIFTGLSELQYLDLSKNVIQTIENGAFSGLIELLSLLLHENKLKVLDDHVFDGPKALRTISLYANQIDNIGNSFCALNHLFSLDLQNNTISDIDLVKISKFPELVHLNLRNTTFDSEKLNISSEELSFLSPLESLDLSNNNITNAAKHQIERIFPKLKDFKF